MDNKIMELQGSFNFKKKLNSNTYVEQNRTQNPTP